jgi:Flp pilus assembly protein protease CpaA
LGFTLLAVSAWLFAQTHSLHLLLVLQFSVGIVFLASLWMHSRAAQLNEPIARAPGTSDIGRGHHRA